MKWFSKRAVELSLFGLDYMMLSFLSLQCLYLNCELNQSKPSLSVIQEPLRNQNKSCDYEILREETWLNVFILCSEPDAVLSLNFGVCILKHEPRRAKINLPSA